MGRAFVFVLSKRMECSANHRSIEQRELTLPFERVRIARSIRIVHGSRFHLVACAEIFKGRANCLRAKKLPGSRGLRISQQLSKLWRGHGVFTP